MPKLLVTLLLAAGCGTSIHATTLNSSPVPMAPRPAHAVELFTSGAPHRPHVDIALLEAEESSSFSLDKTPEMLGKLREKAGAMGCDAIVIGGMSSRDPGLRDKESWLIDNPKGRKGMYGTCIVYTPEYPAVANQQ